MSFKCAIPAANRASASGLEIIDSITMTIAQRIKDLDALPDEATLFVQEPWSALSECIVHSEDVDGPVAALEERYGMSYFLEVDIIKELMEQYMDGSKPLEHEEVVKNLIHYARNDA